MKKATKSIIALILAIAFIASSIAATLIVIFGKTEENYIHIKKYSVTKTVDDSFNLINECGITTYANGENTKPYFISSNSSVLSVGFYNANVVCLSAGEAIISVYLTTDSETIKKEIKVTVLNKIIYPTSLSITKPSVTLTNNVSTTLNPVITDAQNANYVVSYQNNLVEYNYSTGEVRLIQNCVNQSDVVTIKVYKQDGSYLETSFEVQIKDIIEVEVNGTIKLNEDKTFYYTDYMEQSGEPVGVPQISDDTILKYNTSDYGYFNVKGLELGTTQVIVSDGLTKVIFTIEVIEEWYF